MTGARLPQVLTPPAAGLGEKEGKRPQTCCGGDGDPRATCPPPGPAGSREARPSPVCCSQGAPPNGEGSRARSRACGGDPRCQEPPWPSGPTPLGVPGTALGCPGDSRFLASAGEVAVTTSHFTTLAASGTAGRKALLLSTTHQGWRAGAPCRPPCSDGRGPQAKRSHRPSPGSIRGARNQGSSWEPQRDLPDG